MRVMHPKTLLDNAVAAISGVYGGGIFLTIVEWKAELLKLIVAALTALICGGMGIMGKYLFVWTWKKIRSLLKR